MKKSIRVLALIGAIVLALCYLSTLIFALIGTEWATSLFKVSIAATIFIPVIIYACTLFWRLSHSDQEDPENDPDSK